MLPKDSQITALNALMHDVLLSIETYLNPAWLKPAGVEVVRARLSTGALVVIRDAFQSAFAERMVRCLDECTAWKVYEGSNADFHYHHHNLYDARDFPMDLVLCERVFDAPASRDFAARLSGRRCTGPTVFSASLYLPGDHSLPHTDAVSYAADDNRQVAFIWHLAKEWRPEWGGALFWCPRGTYIPPRFNSLVLFNVAPDTWHLVTKVSPYAQGKRLAINGWWTGPDATGIGGDRTSERIDNESVSIEIY
jgi:hypothetical protein